MKSKIIFFAFCIIFWFVSEGEAQTANCKYGNEFFSIYGTKSANSYYSCVLSTKQVKFNEKLTKIEEQHGNGRSDVDVKLLRIENGNKLKTFSSIFCQKFPNLEIIEAADAEIESIDEDSFRDCKYLDKLRLHGNKFRELPKNLFTENSELTLVKIWNSQLITLPENLFLAQNKLFVLDIGGNQINSLPSNIFGPLVKLEFLYLHYNNLESLNPAWFARNLQNLKGLALNGNQITEIQPKAFTSLKKLEGLWLNGNRIKTLNSDSFDGLQNLQRLFLLNNEISDLPAGVFAPLKNLQALELNNNKLTTIHSDSFNVHSRLKEIKLDDNKINAIDEKFIDSTAVSMISIDNNICSQSNILNKENIKEKLRNCFTNYQPRPVQFIPRQGDANSCGRALLPQGNIVGGTQIKRGSYPWIAALVRPNGQFFCGGTLVSSHKVVTAAHCIQDKGYSLPLQPHELFVLLGFHDLSNPSETGRTNRTVQKIHKHPDWNTQTYSHDADIAVVVLEQEVTFNYRIQPICLVTSSSSVASINEGAVVGNGKGGEDNEYENIPKILKMPIQDYDHCLEKDSFFKQLSSGRTFCAGSANVSGVCSGDSGSGFIVKYGGAYYLRGVVSVSLGDPMSGCDVNSFAVFTDALKFYDWINGKSTD